MTIWTASWLPSCPSVIPVSGYRAADRAGYQQAPTSLIPRSFPASGLSLFRRRNTSTSTTPSSRNSIPGALWTSWRPLVPIRPYCALKSAKDIEAGICYCHRHLAAQWLEDSLGIKVEEVGHPDLPRFRYLQGKHFAPSYVRREPVEQLCLFDV